MKINGKPERICVIGAGPCGLAAVKALRDVGVDCTCLEREDDLGGNWYFGRASSSVYETTHLISSKRLTQFADFPMPADYPPYPSHQQALSYLRAYADEFGLRESIRFNTAVERVERDTENSRWHVFLAGEAKPQAFDRVVIANGHHWSPKWPEYPGEFAGEVMHSRDYKCAEVLRGRRVLVVGAGNSGCDIAVEAAQHAAAAFHSVRRGYHFLPKFINGKPVDEASLRLQRWGLPLLLRRWISEKFIHMTLGNPNRFGLPTPDHRLFETHPIVNSQLFYHLGHGTLSVKPDLERLDGNLVRFKDNSAEAVDLIIYATGYQVEFPFIDAAHLNWRDGLPDLYLHSFHPQRDDLFVVGMMQPNGALWPLAELQAKLMAAFIRADQERNEAAVAFRKLKSQASPNLSAGIRFLESPRHRLEVDYYTCRRHLQKLLKRLS